jgi:hypothetical protein
MRALGFVLACLALGTGCGQKVDRPAGVASCDPNTMHCTPTPVVGAGTPIGEAGAASTPTEETSTLTGQVVSFTDDTFAQAIAFTGTADVSADGSAQTRVMGSYDGMSFQLSNVLKTAANWFLVVPAQGTGAMATLMPVDTRALTDGPKVAVARTADVEKVFLNLGTEPATERAQILVHVVDDQGRSVTGEHATLTAEVVAYRLATAWVTNDPGTDDSGLIFLGNVQAGSALAAATISLTGTTSAQVGVEIHAGALTVVTAVLPSK